MQYASGGKIRFAGAKVAVGNGVLENMGQHFTAPLGSGIKKFGCQVGVG